MYGRQRIFSYTIELYPPETPTVWGDHYPPDETIAGATAHNRSALIYFLSTAGCPYAVIGKTVQNCGPFFDDTEIPRGWVVNPDGNDTARSTSRFVRGNPSPTNALAGGCSRTAPSGRYAFVTGASAGSTANTYDLDGQTTIESVPIALPATPGALTFSYVWSHGPSSAADFFRLYVEDEAGTKHLVWHVDGTASTVGASWHQARIGLADYAGQKIRRCSGERRRTRQPGRGAGGRHPGGAAFVGPAAHRIAPALAGPASREPHRALGRQEPQPRRPDAAGSPEGEAMRRTRFHRPDPTGRRGRLALGLSGAALAIFLTATPALACGGLIGPNGAVNLLRTTTFAGYHDGVEHYVTAFQFAGGGGAFGSITPLPGIPTSVEKGGDWTLQRLSARRTRSFLEASPAARRADAAGAVEELMNVKIDALDITVLKGGADDIGAVGDGPRLPAPARRAGGPRLLRAAEPDLPRRGVRRRCGRRRAASRSATARRSTSRSRREPVGAAPDPRPGQDRRRTRRGRRLPPDRSAPGAAAGRRPGRTASAWTRASGVGRPARRPPLRSRDGLDPASRLADEGRGRRDGARSSTTTSRSTPPAPGSAVAVAAGLALPSEAPVRDAGRPEPSVDRRSPSSASGSSAWD